MIEVRLADRDASNAAVELRGFCNRQFTFLARMTSQEAKALSELLYDVAERLEVLNAIRRNDYDNPVFEAARIAKES
jgi:hypothetical protein